MSVVAQNQDGLMDMFSSCSSGTHVYVNNGTSGFYDGATALNMQNLVPVSLTTIIGVAIDDINNDGAVDFVVMIRPGYATLLLNDGTGRVGTGGSP